MNTPAHVALSLAVLGGRGRKAALAILAGAVLPDLALYLVSLDLDPGGARALVPVLESLPLWAAVAALAWLLRLRLLTLAALSAVLHVLLDLPLHASDARAHFWPLSGAVFQSPVSFWDVRHHGRIVGVLEAVLFLACLAVIWRRSGRWPERAAVSALAVAYAISFVHFAGHAFSGAHIAPW